MKPILLVEDNPHDQELALMALTKAGLLNETVMVSDGEEALDYLFSRGIYAGRPPGNPAVVLLDLKMPKLDGIEVLKIVRATPSTAYVPIVMLTGSQEETDISRSYQNGVNAFIVKPMDFMELVRAVGEAGAFWALINEPPVGSFKSPPKAE
jgi:CheY-like chemotaxis protein